MFRFQQLNCGVSGSEVLELISLGCTELLEFTLT